MLKHISWTFGDLDVGIFEYQVLLNVYGTWNEGYLLFRMSFNACAE